MGWVKIHPSYIYISYIHLFIWSFNVIYRGPLFHLSFFTIVTLGQKPHLVEMEDFHGKNLNFKGSDFEAVPPKMDDL